MTSFRLFFPLTLLVVFSLTGCVDIKQPYRQVTYYTLEYQPPEFPGLEPVPVTIRVQDFTTSPAYDTERLIYRDTSYSRNAYNYHRWRARPGKLVRDFLARDLTRSGLFQAVVQGSNVGRADYLLEGSVEEFLEWDQEGHWEAVMTITATLLVAREPNVSQRIVFQKSFSARQESEAKNPQAIAAAMSQAMTEISREVILAIHSAVQAARD